MTMYPPDWVARYVGIPYLLGGSSREGADCFGLCDLVMRERAGFSIVPEQAPRPSDDGREVLRVVMRHRREWLDVEDGGQFGDVVIMRVARNSGRGIHMGLLLDNSSWMLHTEEGTDAVPRNLLRHRDVERRVLHTMRHPRMAQ